MSRVKESLDFLESDNGAIIGKAITGGLDREKKAHELFKAEAIKRPLLTSDDITTIHDVDIYRNQKAYKGGLDHIPSRFDALKEPYDEKKADMMLRSLEVRLWKLGK